MGTSLHRYRPTTADWGYGPDGKSLLNLSDALAYTRPDWIRDIHRGFFAVGCDAVETNTFNANAVGLAEFGMAGQLDEINRLNVRLAREAAAEFSTPARPRFVVGSVGPGTKMPSMIDKAIYIDFDTLGRGLPAADRGAGRGAGATPSWSKPASTSSRLSASPSRRST